MSDTKYSSFFRSRYPSTVVPGRLSSDGSGQVGKGTMEILEDAQAPKANLAVKAAIDAGATEEQLAATKLKLREAQFYWDWIAAENGNGFHNPDKCMRVSGEAIDLAHQVIEEANSLAHI